MASMFEAIVHPDISSTLRKTPVPVPAPEEVLIRVVVSGSNPKDYKRPENEVQSFNSGDDIAGVVVSAGAHVAHMFERGARVAALHTLGRPHGSFAEYALATADCTFRLPDAVDFEQAATIPLAAMTAAVGLFMRLGLPTPWMSADDDFTKSGNPTRGYMAGPLLVYGAASAVGAFAIQLAKRARVGPIIAVAGKGIPFVEAMLDTSSTGGDSIVDYRDGNESVVEGLREALRGRELQHAFDCVSEAEKHSYANICQVIAPGGKLVLVLPASMQKNGRYEGIPEHVHISNSMVLEVAERYTAFGAAMSSLFEKGLRDGWLKPHPHEVIPGGLSGVQHGLRNLKSGKASAIKYVFRIAETPGLS